LENPDLQAATARLIRKSRPERWMVQPTLLDRSPGFVANRQELARRLDPVPAAVRSSARRLSAFERRSTNVRRKSGEQWFRRHTLGLMLLAVFLNASTVDATAAPAPRPAEEVELVFALEPVENPIWRDKIGEGYRTSTQTMSLEVGASYGPAAMGSQEHHHLALLSMSYGHMVGPMIGGDRWWRGNFELRLELFGGLQFAPDYEWLAGLTPHIRYHFTTGGRWVPFLDGGVGVSFTGIGPPDLGSTFEFNVQCSAGIHWYLGDRLALTAEARYLHLSNAGLSEPNAGLNGFVGMLGLTRSF
jgi:hypothetical protein